MDNIVTLASRVTGQTIVLRSTNNVDSTTLFNLVFIIVEKLGPSTGCPKKTEPA